MDKEECGICYISCLIGSIVYLECCHSLCRECLKKLQNHVCPFCRHAISPPVWFKLVITQTITRQSMEDRILDISENTIIRRRKRKKKRKSDKSSIKSFSDKKRQKRRANRGKSWRTQTSWR